MLSRHFLRSKVLQTVYAVQVDPVDTVVAEKNFTHNIERLNVLGIIQVSALVHFFEVVGVMIDEAQHKFLPTDEERNPNRRLQNNVFLQKLADNYDLRHHVEDAKISWGGVEYDEIFRQAYAGFVKMPEYKEYLKSMPSFDSDHHFALKVFKYLMNYPLLCENLYPKSLLWEDDFDQIAQYNFMMLKAIDETFDEASALPLVYDSRNARDQEAFDFACRLLRSTLRHVDEVEVLIRKNLKGWDFERIAGMDILLINMAVAELTEFSSIPERVTVDEYIELSKEFSTDRSKLFINGILDKLMIELRSAGRINKSGRGLLDPKFLEDYTDEEENQN